MHKDTWKHVSAAVMAFIYTTQVMSCGVAEAGWVASRVGAAVPAPA